MYQLMDYYCFLSDNDLIISAIAFFQLIMLVIQYSLI